MSDPVLVALFTNLAAILLAAAALLNTMRNTRAIERHETLCEVVRRQLDQMFALMGRAAMPRHQQAAPPAGPLAPPSAPPARESQEGHLGG